ncbi:ATP-binding protein [Pseudotabrizicola sp. 4114]|uniref:ATP-binding protein n=1 Tax=Pseudotabrizicola sp. 4114 TaxID=2817731 RepID=UPI002860D62C|nr:PAS domain S-box-containing protein [Pseudorhodobacter sp. 4114]
MTIFQIRPRKPLAGSIRTLAVVALVLALLAMIGTLVLDVRDRMSDLERADSDNGQWVMMQTEVEVLRLQTTLVKAQSGQTGLEDVRRWFNVLYSRLRMLEQSPLYGAFILQPENLSALKAMQAFIDRWVSTVDSSDAVLATALQQMASESEEVQRLARDLSLRSLQAFSAGTDRTRARVSDTLTQLAVTIAATILLLVMLAVMAMRLYRVTQRQAKENQTVGERLQLIIATSPDAIVVTNRGGWVVEFNPAAEAMFGFTRQQMMGQQIVPMLFSDDERDAYESRLRGIVSRAVQAGPQRFELTGHRASGQPFPLEVSMAVRDLNRGALIVGFLRDISRRQADQLALEQALTQARAGEKAKAKFLAVMSHEMRTPLNGLIGSMEQMHDTDLDDTQRELLRVMEISGDILLSHVESVLDLSSAEAGQIRLADTAFDLERLIGDCIATQAGIARTNGTSIRHVMLTGPLGPVRGDPGRVQQILLNLIGNAVKFTRNGTITVETERLPRKTGSTTAPMVEVRVIDTGIGIPKSELTRVFEDFATVDSSYGRETGGTGLGLGIARRLVQAMGGSIGVESEPGEGSLFWLRLPLPPAEAALPLPVPAPAPDKTASPPQTDTPVLDVLIIEDNEINRFLLRRTLISCNHRVTEASDGLEGVAAAAKTRFDVIITDISMPRLDGIEASRRIRAGGASRAARIIALTAHALPEEQERFRLAGMDACLTKPVNRETLLAHLQPGPALPTGSGHPAQPTLLKTDSLHELAETVGHPVMLSLMTRMLAEGDATLAQITAHPVPDDDMARAAHRLAGSSSTFGAVALCEALSALELAIRRDQLTEATRLIARLPALWDDTREALSQYSALLIA